MKKATVFIFSAALGACLAGCGTLRESQDPQPKMQAPCKEWLSAKPKPAKPARKAPPKKSRAKGVRTPKGQVK